MDFKVKKLLFKNLLQKGLFFFGVVVSLAVFSPQAYANVIGNPGFEEGIGNGTDSNWDITNGAARVQAPIAGGFSAPPEGTFALSLDGGDFTFQTFDKVKEGDFVTFSALAEASFPASAVAGGQMVIEFKKINSDGSDTTLATSATAFITSGNAPAGGGFTRFTATGTAPGGTQRVVFVLRTFGVGVAAGDVVFDDVDGEVQPAKLSAFSSKSSVKVGEPVAIHAQFRNASDITLTGIKLFAGIPDGFDADFDSARVDGKVTGTSEGSLIINVGDVGPNQTVNVGFVIIPTSAVAVGHDYTLTINLFNGSELSDGARVKLRVAGDPVFNEAPVIGKVFNDINRNGIQDSCAVMGTSEECSEQEYGVPWVRLMTEEGIVVTTDKDGKYHIPGLKPGRHIIKIDGHSLPQGTEFVTEESYLIKTSPGIMSKANFAVVLPPSNVPEAFREDLTMTVTQGIDYTQPVLDVTMEPELVKMGIGVLETNPVFKFKTNYREFIKRWYLEIRNELGRPVWTGFGVGKPPPEVSWGGMTEEGVLLKPGIYSYQFKIEDPQGHEDWTPLKFFRAVSKADADRQKNVQIEIPTVGDFNIFKDGKQTIPLVAKPVLRVQGKTKPGHEVTVNSLPVEVNQQTGDFNAQLYVQPGEKDVVVTTTSPEGETTTAIEKVDVKDSMFFMVALGETEMGTNIATGNLETAGRKDRFKDGFYSEGRLSYYLVGKLKGKFLFKSAYDTERERSALFTNLDPEDYYPVYGDASVRDYEGRDTKDLFFVIEMDRSFAKWGSFETEFNDTELSTYNRTLHGLKVHFETLKQTPYGDPRTGFKAFWTKAKHRADHNEIASTGGSLYYLRNRAVIEGSEKVRVEYRDPIQDIAVSSYDLREGVDYEIDYDEGRILLNKPLPVTGTPQSGFSETLLNGQQAFLIVDYEFDGGLDLSENNNRGLRGYTHLGEHIKLGLTALEEKRRDQDYDLRGVDLTMKVGRNTKIVAEYATTKLEQVEQGISFNGGLTYADLDPIALPDARIRENAYLIKGESKPIKNLELTGYIQGVEPGFSTERLKSQEGTKKYGMSALYRINENGFIRYRFDHSEVSDSTLPLEENNLTAAFEETQSQLVQAAYDDGKWLAQAEYMNQSIELPEQNLLETLTSEVPFEHGLAGKLGYRINDRLLPYVRAQTTMGGKGNHQFGGGVRYEVTKDIVAYFEQMIGNLGDSSLIGFHKTDSNGAQSYANIRMFDRGVGAKTLTTAIGSSFPLSQKSRFYSEREYSVFNGEEGHADIMGVEGKMGSRWTYNVRYERSRLKNSTTRLLDIQAQNSILRTNTFNVVAGSIKYSGNRYNAGVYLEGRRDQDVPKLWQIVNRTYFDYSINQDLSFRTNFNYGFTKDRAASGGRPANFMEFNTGFAYRPVHNDRFNMLARYTYVRDIANDAQFASGLFAGSADIDQISHIIATDFAYDINRYLGLVQKIAYRKSELRTAVTGNVTLNSFLWGHRFNFHVTRKWDVALEYRFLWSGGVSENFQHGALFEIDREFYDYVRLGVGYDFTDFNDNLRDTNEFASHGPFVRLTGKF